MIDPVACECFVVDVSSAAKALHHLLDLHFIQAFTAPRAVATEVLPHFPLAARAYRQEADGSIIAFGFQVDQAQALNVVIARKSPLRSLAASMAGSAKAYSPSGRR
ncbi:MAG: hypothetical protein R2856_38660 [Caldilineaceae bacterium]